MRIATYVLCAGLLTACSRPEKSVLDASTPPQASAPKESALKKVDAGADLGAFVGVIRGVVKLAPGAKLPLAPPVLSHGAKPPSMPPCPPVDENDQRVVTQADATGGLSPVHVALTGMTTAPPVEPRTHQLFIDACRLRPTVLGVRKGDTVEVTNRSDQALVPALPGAPFMRAMLRGETHSFEAKSVQSRVQCSFGSYCGEALVIATTHSLYDVTTPEGFFTIENVPLDQPLVVHAWHPLFKENGVQVTLSKERPDQMVEILLTPWPPKTVPDAGVAAPRKAAKPSSVRSK